VAITWADVQAIAPELTNTAVPTATQAVLLAMVDRQIDDTAWDDLADDGRRYLAAHMGALYANGSNAGGSVIAESVGPLSRSYAAPGVAMGSLGTTKYGMWYLQLIRLLPSSLGFVP